MPGWKVWTDMRRCNGNDACGVATGVDSRLAVADIDELLVVRGPALGDEGVEYTLLRERRRCVTDRLGQDHHTDVGGERRRRVRVVGMGVPLGRRIERSAGGDPVVERDLHLSDVQVVPVRRAVCGREDHRWRDQRAAAEGDAIRQFRHQERDLEDVGRRRVAHRSPLPQATPGPALQPALQPAPRTTRPMPFGIDVAASRRPKAVADPLRSCRLPELGPICSAGLGHRPRP